MALTAEQAAKRLGRTERTIRRWIEDGKLAAFHPTFGRTGKFLIEEAEVERLAGELAQYEQPAEPGPGPEDITSLVERMTQLEQRVRSLEDALLLTVTPYGEASPELLQQATEARTRTRRVTAAEPPVELPSGSLLLKDFAEKHGVNRRTFEDQVKKGIAGEQVATLVFANPKRADEVKRWLTPEQQRAAIDFWQRYGVAYTPCSECPHEQDQG